MRSNVQFALFAEEFHNGLDLSDNFVLFCIQEFLLSRVELLILT
jgi:hypothetical protein